MKIFLGGCYSEEKAVREKVAQYGKRIDKAIRKCGYEPSLNLLGNPKVHNETKKADGIKFSDGEYFLKVGEKVVSSFSRKEMESVRGVRAFESEEQFLIKYMACNIALTELQKSVAGIFELSAVSQGSYLEIGLLIYHYQVPVLALSHEEWGRHFGTMLIGSPSPLLQTVKYNDKNLDEIIDGFLLKDLPEKKLKLISFRIPALLERKLKDAAAQNGFQTSSELFRHALEKYLSEP